MRIKIMIMIMINVGITNMRKIKDRDYLRKQEKILVLELINLSLS